MWMPSYTCQVVLLFQAFFDVNIANCSHIHFPKNSHHKHADEAGLGVWLVWN